MTATLVYYLSPFFVPKYPLAECVPLGTDGRIIDANYPDAADGKWCSGEQAAYQMTEQFESENKLRVTIINATPIIISSLPLAYILIKLSLATKKN